MERNLERVLEDVMEVPEVTGCVLTNSQGLCLGVKGKASHESAGIIKAIASQVSRLEPNSKTPVILFENDTRQCLIQSHGNVTAAIYKAHTATA